MSSPKFEHVRQANPELADLLDRLMTYIESQYRNDQQFILPKLAAAALSLNEGEAYVLLEILADAGVLERAFNVYCEEKNMLLATVHSEAELAAVPDCDYCDKCHSRNELKLEIAFELPPDGSQYRKAA